MAVYTIGKDGKLNRKSSMSVGHLVLYKKGSNYGMGSSNYYKAVKASAARRAK